MTAICGVPVKVCSFGRALAMLLHARPSLSIVVVWMTATLPVTSVAESPSSIANEQTIFFSMSPIFGRFSKLERVDDNDF